MEASAGIVRIGRESLAAGLFWQPAPSARQAFREARIVASKAELAADLFCVRCKGVPQFGLGQKKIGHRTGMRAVAAVLANSVDEASWIGVFKLDTEWLYVMVRKGAVMPDGDLVFAIEDEARERLLSELSVGGWDAVFAPATWHVPGARFDRIADLLHTDADARLRAVVQSPLNSALFFAAVLAAGAGIWILITPSTHEVPIVPEVPVAPPPPPVPWQGQPKVAALIQACQSAIEETATIPGYELESVSCGPSGTVANYRRQWGEVSWLPRNSTVISPDRARIALPLLANIDARADGEQPWTADALRRLVWASAQKFRLDSEYNEPPIAAQSSLPGRVAANDELPINRQVTISLGAPLPAGVLTGILGKIPTFIVEEVVWQPPSWRVKGKAYVR